MRALRLDGYAGCRELDADGLSRWLEVDLTDRGSTRQVVVRQLSPELSQHAALRAAFLQAGEQHAQLVHPNLCQVIDWGIWDSSPCIVRDALVGMSLGRIMKASRAQREPLSAALAAYVAHSLLTVLAYAAVRLPGSLHLDVCPERVQVSPSGSLHLSEFGVWSLLEPDERTRRRLEAGEVHYLAPEIVQSLPCDARSDLFSVGAILFEIVAAQCAFAGSTPLATAVEAAAGRRRELRTACDAPDALCTFIERLLAPCLNARFQSASEALVALGDLSQLLALGDLSQLLAQGQHDLRERIAGLAHAPRGDASAGLIGAPHGERMRRGAVTSYSLSSGMRPNAEVQTVRVAAPHSVREHGVHAIQPPRSVTKAQGPAALAGVVTQFLFRPFRAREPLAVPPLFAAPASAETQARAFEHGPVGEPPTLAPPPMAVVPRAPAAVAVAFPTFASFVCSSASTHAPGLAVDQRQVLIGAPSLCGVESARSSPYELRRFTARTVTHDSGGEPWRDPSRTVFFAKAYARGKTLKRVSKMPWLAVVALSALFGSSLLGSLYLLYRVLR